MFRACPRILHSCSSLRALPLGVISSLAQLFSIVLALPDALVSLNNSTLVSFDKAAKLGESVIDFIQARVIPVNFSMALQYLAARKILLL